MHAPGGGGGLGGGWVGGGGGGKGVGGGGGGGKGGSGEGGGREAGCFVEVFVGLQPWCRSVRSKCSVPGCAGE